MCHTTAATSLQEKQHQSLRSPRRSVIRRPSRASSATYWRLVFNTPYDDCQHTTIVAYNSAIDQKGFMNKVRDTLEPSGVTVDHVSFSLPSAPRRHNTRSGNAPYITICNERDFERAFALIATNGNLYNPSTGFEVYVNKGVTATAAVKKETDGTDSGYSTSDSTQ